MKLTLLLVPLAIFIGGVIPQKEIPVRFDETSVMLHVGEGDRRAYGSGVVFKNGEDEFVWTAGHVVEASKKIDGNGFNLIEVIKITYKNGEEVNRSISICEVVRYSPFHEYDLALLKTLSPIANKSCEFSFEEALLGEEVFFIGSPALYHNLYLKGYVCAERRGHFTQYDLAVTGGASGGPVFSTKNGKCLGLITMVHTKQQCLSFAVASTIMYEFCKKVNCEWAMDNTISVPSNYMDQK